MKMSVKINAFEFATANRIIFGRGTISQVGPVAKTLGNRAFVVTGANQSRAKGLLDTLAAHGIESTCYAITQEPTVALIQDATEQARSANCDLVVGFGGGSPVDAGKAIAAFLTNPGDPFDYLEVIGKGQKLLASPVPYIAIPTTAGTGSEVTRNAVLASPEHRVKVSLRSPQMLPDVAIVDPALTDYLPPQMTAYTGMDALTQVMEPLVSIFANPLTDALCWEGIERAARALRSAYKSAQSGQVDADAREDMAITSLFGGLALANAKLGAVHGFAGPLGGMFDAPHGAVCATLLPHVMAINVQILQSQAPTSPAIGRYRRIAQQLTRNPNATVADGVQWVEELSQDLSIPTLSDYGIIKSDFPDIIAKSANSSSMKGNPIVLKEAELHEILVRAL